MNEFAVRQVDAQASDSVLEIGFGGGLSLQRLLDAAGHLTGVDRSDVMVRQAKSNFRKAINDGRADFVVGNVEALTFETAAFDKVITVNTIYFWTSLEAGFKQIRRVLAPGGRAIIGFLPNEHMARMNMPADIFTLRSIDGVTDALLKAGFSQANVERPDSSTKWAVVVASN